MSWYTPIAQGGGMGDYAPANPFVGQFNYGGDDWFLSDASPMQNSGLNVSGPVYKAQKFGGGGNTEGFFTLGPDGKPQLVHDDFNKNNGWIKDARPALTVLAAAGLGYGADQLGLLGGATPNSSLAWASGGAIPGYGAAAPALGAAGGAAGASGQSVFGGADLFGNAAAGIPEGTLAGAGGAFGSMPVPGAGFAGGLGGTLGGASFGSMADLMPITSAIGAGGAIPGVSGGSPSVPPGAPPSSSGTQTPGAGNGLLDWMKANPGLAMLGAGLLGGLADGSKVEDLYGGRKTAIDRLNANKAPASPWGRY